LDWEWGRNSALQEWRKRPDRPSTMHILCDTSSLKHNWIKTNFHNNKNFALTQKMQAIRNKNSPCDEKYVKIFDCFLTDSNLPLFIVVFVILIHCRIKLSTVSANEIYNILVTRNAMFDWTACIMIQRSLSCLKNSNQSQNAC